jgi:hypothetical protein
MSGAAPEGSAPDIIEPPLSAGAASHRCSGDGLDQPAAGFSHIELSYVTTFYFN